MKRQLRRFLRRRGASDAEIENAARGRYLALLVLDREILPGARRYTMTELAEHGGTDVETARAVWRALGFPDFPDDLPAFTESDAETMRSFIDTFTRPLVIDWSLDVALSQARVVSSALARVADSVTDDIALSFRRARDAELSDDVLAEMLADRVDFDSIERLVSHVFRIQLRAAVWRRLAGADPEAPGTLRGAVGFVDLVGYTALAEELDDDELAKLLRRFGDIAHDTVVSGGGRIVKTIGDEVMFVTDTEVAAAAIAVALTERSTGDELLPDTRAGIAAGHLVAREGDYFGPVVNLASRLTELARPGTVLAPADLATALEHDPRFVVRRVSTRRVRDIGRVDMCAIGAAPS
ncbi:MAG: adenylate/guanylate cyclase domain-containing protein [Acidimicrobiia bacterium]